MPDSPHKRQWHPAFYAAAGLELKANHQELQMISEYNLSKEPILIDFSFSGTDRCYKAIIS